MEKVHPMASPGYDSCYVHQGAGMILGPGMDLKLKAEHQVHKFQEMTIYYIYIYYYIYIIIYIYIQNHNYER